MSDIIKMENIQDLIFEIRGVKVILDSDVADLYGVETRDINKAVKNNPDKFPDSYVFELNKVEFEDLRWKISTAKNQPPCSKLQGMSGNSILPLTLTLSHKGRGNIR